MRILKVWAETRGDYICLVDAQHSHLVPVSATPVDGSSNMKVQMRNRLVRIHAVVLPNAETWALLYLVDS